MTNTTLLKAKIDASGYKMKYIANRIGLSYQGFLNKIRNKTDFTAPEIKSLCELLHIGTEEMEQILNACDRKAAGPTAPAHGLLLKSYEFETEISTKNL